MVCFAVSPRWIIQKFLQSKKKKQNMKYKEWCSPNKFPPVFVHMLIIGLAAFELARLHRDEMR